VPDHLRSKRFFCCAESWVAIKMDKTNKILLRLHLHHQHCKKKQDLSFSRLAIPQEKHPSSPVSSLALLPPPLGFIEEAPPSSRSLSLVEKKR
jgi:hypothetical protein